MRWPVHACKRIPAAFGLGLLLLLCSSRFSWAGWTTSNVDTTGRSGTYSNIVIDSSGNPHIVYRQESTALLWAADYSGSSWTVTQSNAGNNMGWGTFAVIDSANNLYVSYEGTSPKRLYFSKRTGSTWGTQVQAV